MGYMHAAQEGMTRRFKAVYEDFYTKHRTARFYHQTSEWIPDWVVAVALALLYALTPTLATSFGLTAGTFASVVKSWLSLQVCVLHKRPVLSPSKARWGREGQEMAGVGRAKGG